MKERYYCWDCLKIILAFVVFLFHTNIHLGLTYGLLTDFISVGAFCMTGFFMLSGAVLSLRYEESKWNHEEILIFYKTRFISIFPLYYVVILIYIFNKSYIIDDLLLLPVELLGLQSLFYGSFSYGSNNGTWFVSCLLICYLLFPMISIMIKGMNSRKLLLVTFFLGVFDVYTQFIVGYFGFGELYSAPFLRLIQFMMGSIICVLLKRKKSIRFKHSLLLYIFVETVLVIVASTILEKKEFLHNASYLQQIAMYDVVGVPAFATLIYWLGQITMNETIGTWVSRVCKTSYAFYMSQLFALKIAKKIFLIWSVSNSNVKLSMSFLICFIITFLFYYLDAMIKKKLKLIFERTK